MSVRAAMRKAARAGVAGTLDRVLQVARIRAERRAAGCAVSDATLRSSGASSLRSTSRLWSGLRDGEIRNLAARGDTDRAQELLLDAMRRRTPVLPSLADLAATISAAQPFRPAILAAADRALAHRFLLFGWLEADAGADINWLREPTTGTIYPLDFWADLDLEGEASGNTRVLWELNRHQHLPRLAAAYCLTGDQRYAAEIGAQMQSWIAHNPWGLGANWASSLEVALRAIAWLWAHALLLRADALTPRLNAEAVAALGQAGAHIARHLSYTYSPNTHLLGEALGLLYLGAMLPELSAAPRWLALGRRILTREAQRQFLADGFHFEHSTWYHRFATDIYLHAAVLCGQAGRPLPPATLAAIERMLECLSALRTGAGAGIAMGDDDGGQLLPLAHLPPGDVRDTLALGAALLGRDDLRPQGAEPAEAVLWLLGEEAFEAGGQVAPAPRDTGSRTLPGVRLVIMQGGAGPCMAFDCAGAAGPDSAHDHADALSLQLHGDEGPLLVDPGTYAYTGSREWRDYFRGTAAHNTAVIDHACQAQPDGPFAWRRAGEVRRWESLHNPGFDFAQGHYRYQQRRGGIGHLRRVLYVKPHYWLICDFFAGEGEHDLEQWFHFPPCRATLDECSRCAAQTPGGTLVIAAPPGDAQARIVEGATKPIQGWVSDAFARKSAAPALCYSTRAHLPAGLVALVAPCEDERAVTIERLPGAGDRAVTVVAVGRSAGRDLILLAPPDGRRREFGDLAHFACDAEVACVQRSPSGSVRAVSLCGGSSLECDGEAMVSLARRCRHFHAEREGDSISIWGPLSGGAYLGWPARQVALNGRLVAFERRDSGVSLP
jgi:hypothetical protein